MKIRWIPAVFALLFPSLAAGILRAEVKQAGIAQALELYAAQRYTEARALLNELHLRNGPNPELDFFRGRLALWFDDSALAIECLERAAHCGPEEARVQHALGDAFGLAALQAPLWRKLPLARRSLAAYERAVALAPADRAFRWSLLGFHCMAPAIAGGSRAKARAEAREIARLDSWEGTVAAATVALAEERYDAAFAEFERVLAGEPDHFPALYQIGRCAALSGKRLEDGIAALRRCLTLPLPPGESALGRASVHYRLGMVLEKSGRRAEAAESFAMARAIHPDFRPTKLAAWH